MPAKSPQYVYVARNHGRFRKGQKILVVDQNTPVSKMGNPGNCLRGAGLVDSWIRQGILCKEAPETAQETPVEASETPEPSPTPKRRRKASSATTESAVETSEEQTAEESDAEQE